MTLAGPVPKICVAGAIALAIAGCASVLEPRPDPSKFYLLTPAAESGAPTAGAPRGAAGDLAIGLGPVKLPAYLDRPEIVTRAASNRLELSKIDRWGEPLADNFTQVLSRDLAARLGTQQIVLFPWYDTTRIDVQVRVEVYRFDCDAHGNAQLTAQWTLLGGAGKNVLYTAQSAITQAAAMPGDGEAGAAALSRAVDGLAGEIALQMARLRLPRDGRRQG